MKQSPKPFKPPPKRHAPKGVSILYEDQDILVVDKKGGVLTVSNDKVREQTAYFSLTNYVRKGNVKSRNRIFLVHRLERNTSGVMIFAKNPNAKQFLQELWPEVKKIYVAVVEGHLPDSEGLIESYLAESGIRTMYSVEKAQKGKLARTAYRVLQAGREFSLVELDLQTERQHQIRVHLGEQGCPVVGDKKYGAKEKGARRLMLHARSLTIQHPYSEEEMTFTAKTPVLFDAMVKPEKNA